jgi:hypothetical protein
MNQVDNDVLNKIGVQVIGTGNVYKGYPDSEQETNLRTQLKKLDFATPLTYSRKHGYDMKLKLVATS